MLNNDVLRSLRYLLDLPDAHLAELAARFGEQVEADLLEAYLKKEDEDGFQACPDRYLARCLDGLIIQRRGRDESRPLPPLELPLSNNMILKKLRVAFELKEEDLHAILDSVDFPVSKPGFERPVSQARPQQLPDLRRPVAAQLPQGPDPARPWLNARSHCWRFCSRRRPASTPGSWSAARIAPA